MEVTDFDPRDIRIRRYQVGEPQPSRGGNAGLREMLLKTMLALPAAEIERRAQEAEAERARRFQADEAENNRIFGAAESDRERRARGEEAKAGREFTGGENRLERELRDKLSRDELAARGNPLGTVLQEEALKNAAAQGDESAIRKMVPDAQPDQIRVILAGEKNKASNQLADPETQGQLLARIGGLADAEPGDQPSAAQNWQRAHERADNLLSGFGAADSETKNAIRERLKKAYMEKLRVRFPGADQEFETPKHERLAPLRFLARSEV